MSKPGRPTKDEDPRPTTVYHLRLNTVTKTALDVLEAYYQDDAELRGQRQAIIRRLIIEAAARISRKQK